MSKDKAGEPRMTCKHCKHCTPYMEFHTLSLKGQPTMGTCPYWTTSKCVLLSLDSCNHFDVRDEYSGITSSQKEEEERKELERNERKEAISKMREDFAQNTQVILPTLTYGKQKKTAKRKKNG